MSTGPLREFLRRVRRAAAAQEPGSLGDAQLLERFVTSRDEAAFEVLVRRHGPMVLGVCRRVLADEHEAEDAFQATFLMLVRKAGSIRRRAAVAGWLYQVAYRAALRARTGGARRATCEKQAGGARSLATEAGEPCDDLRVLLDEEVNRLPEKYRVPVVLCYLEGKTNEEAARQLGCPRGTVLSRLAWARQRLRSRLTRRGLALADGMLATVCPRFAAPALPVPLADATINAGLRVAAGAAARQVVSANAAALAAGVLRSMFLNKLKWAAAVVLVAAVVILGAALVGQRAAAEKPQPETAPETRVDEHTVRLTPDGVAKLGIRTLEVKRRAVLEPRPLELTGRLEVDSDRLLQIHSRFAGEVVEVGTTGEKEYSRPLRTGDRVKKGQVLAVVWSKDLAEKKSELVDALTQLRLDQATWERLKEAYEKGAIAEAAFAQARGVVEQDRNAVTRAERTLRIWRLSDEEIKALHDEAEHAGGTGERDPNQVKARARVEIRAPLDGTLLEKNVTLGEQVEPATVLFKIADLERLLVLASAAESDLPALHALQPEQRRWIVHIAADPEALPLEGRIDSIGASLDPNTGTVLLRGSIPNAGGSLRPGQFVRVTVPLAPPVPEVTVPASALVTEGGTDFVFVQPDPKQPVYVLRRVAVVRRGEDTVHIRSILNAEEEQRGLQPLRPGERVVTAGALELKAALDDGKEKAKP